MTRAASMAALALVVLAGSNLYAQQPEPVVLEGDVAVAPAPGKVEGPAPGNVETPAPSKVEGPAPARLSRTVHPSIPNRPADFWLVPDTTTRTSRTETPAQKFARGARLIDKGEFVAGLPLVTVDLSNSPLASYAKYYRALALAGLNRLPEALFLLEGLDTGDLNGGYLQGEAVPLERADLEVARQSASKAVDILKAVGERKTLLLPEAALIRLGRAAEAAGDRARAIDAYRKVYYGSPLSEEALDAQNLLARIDNASMSDRFRLELARAERLFNARRWAQARAGFQPLVDVATGDDRELVALRLAECDYYLDRFRPSRDALRPYLENASRKAEARFFSLTATRALGEVDSYIEQAHALVDQFPDSTWAAETLNNLASHYIIADDDAGADEVFRELARRFPDNRYAERANWKIGWWAYRNGRFADAAQAFETGASRFPRGDTRPAWLYWSGRAHDQLDEGAIANERYRLVVTDYENSYYGRLAGRVLAARNEPIVDDNVTISPAPVGVPVPTAPVIRELVGLELYDAAIKELQYAQRAWGNSPVLEATIAKIRHDQSDGEVAPDRFDHLRGGITTMKRAYPQYLAAGGEGLPAQVLEVIFPLDYWPLIEKYSKSEGLDPYLMAALIAQESTFTADVRSAANAYGLMQLVPATGRVYARKIGLRYSQRLLTAAEPNIRMGMRYFKELSSQLGGVHYALASYNAGPSKVAAWIDERGELPQDEFIDDIPYPETQAYVKRILGTAEDYRRLYGGGILKTTPTPNPPAPRASVSRRAPAKKASASKKTR